MWSNLGESARFRGDFAAAEKLYQKALDAVREIGHRESEAIYLTNLSVAMLGLGKFAEAESELRKAIALTDGENFCSLSETFSGLTEAFIGQGKFDDALTAARRALSLARDSENDLDIGTAWRVLGQALSVTSNGNTSTETPPRQRLIATNRAAETPLAEDCFTESLAVFQKIKAEVEQARTLRAWAQHDRTHGRSSDSSKRLALACDIFHRLGARGEVAATEALLKEPVQDARFQS